MWLQAAKQRKMMKASDHEEFSVFAIIGSYWYIDISCSS